MKNHLPFDQHFKAQLQDAESFVPNHLFEKMMAERDKRRGVVLYLQNNWFKYGVTACAIMAGIGVTYLKSISQTKKVATITMTDKAANQKPKGIVSIHIDAPKPLILNYLAHLNVKSNTALNTVRPMIFSQNQRKPDLNPTNVPIATQPSIQVQQQHTADLNPKMDLRQLETPQIIEAISADALIMAVIPIPMEINVLTPDKSKKAVISPSVTPIASIKKQQVMESYSVKTSPRMTFGPDLSCPNFSLRKPNRWYIDIWGSPDYVFRKIYSNPNKGESTNYANARDSVEQSWYGFSAGVRGSLVLESGVALRAGLNYLQNNEVFDYKKPGEVRTVTITESVKQADGTIRTETRSEKHYGTYEIKKYNRYRSLDLPIQLGYEFGSMPWSFSVNGGINFNLTSWRKAEILDSTLQPFDASPKDANVFKSNIGTSLYASFAAYYDWKDYTQLFVEPYIRHFVSPITTTDYALEQRYTDAGLKLGVRWRL
ncbi:MAG: hypothetical protein RL329_2648 [Bacteroidota bacterium]|jgi:hypothetical protein